MTLPVQGPAPAPSTVSPGEMSDHELVADYLRGDPAAVATVSLWIKQAAGRYGGRLPTEWDDLLQDLLVEVTVVLQDDAFRGESVSSFRAQTSPFRYLTPVASRREALC